MFVKKSKKTSTFYLSLVVLCCFFSSCLFAPDTKEIPIELVELKTEVIKSSKQQPDSLKLETIDNPLVLKTENCALEERLIKAGLTDVHTYDSTIMVDLKYATTDNFLGINLYKCLNKAYLQDEVAKKLALAHKRFKKKYPKYRFKIWDAARPRSVQQIFWDLINKPERLKHLYVARPWEGSAHNYGIAVDLTIVNRHGKELDMGTHFDYFGYLAYPIKEKEMLAAGQLSTKAVKNRELLRKYMCDAGFIITNTEWWHFSAMSRSKAKKIYKIIE
ncbi:MAG: peptidase M15 [Bacteroidia bacterium]|nr:MAG: peptidase M15 [Bacteroidia bacterium]